MKSISPNEDNIYKFVKFLKNYSLYNDTSTKLPGIKHNESNSKRKFTNIIDKCKMFAYYTVNYYEILDKDYSIDVKNNNNKSKQTYNNDTLSNNNVTINDITNSYEDLTNFITTLLDPNNNIKREQVGYTLNVVIFYTLTQNYEKLLDLLENEKLLYYQEPRIVEYANNKYTKLLTDYLKSTFVDNTSKFKPTSLYSNELSNEEYAVSLILEFLKNVKNDKVTKKLLLISTENWMKNKDCNLLITALYLCEINKMYEYTENQTNTSKTLDKNTSKHL